MKRLPWFVAVILGCVLTTSAWGADWPQYRHDAGRSAASQESLAASLHLAWVRELPAPRPVFPGEIRLRYDATYEPVVLGKTMFVPSMVTDSVTALDTETGAERWRFFAEGPVRFAPVAWQDKIYFVSDDGHLYCVGAADGKLLWKVRGLPSDREDRKLLGNGRLISLFPARGGPVLAEGVVYFAAGIWAGEGVFVYALDATSGQVLWSNTDSHRIEKANMDHGVGYFAGLSPQGHLAIVDGRLVVPCGAQLPALLDLKTGTTAAYTMGWGGRIALPKGCAFVAGIGKYLFHAGDLYDIQQPNQERFRDAHGRPDFKRMLYLGGLTRLQIDRTNQKGLGHFREPVLTQEAMYYHDNGIVASDLTKAQLAERASLEIPSHRKDDQYPDKMKATFPELWKLPCDSIVHIKAATRLYCGAAGVVEAVQIPQPGEPPQITWRAEIEGTPHRMLAADGKLFVVTLEGRIYAFGEQQPTEPVVHAKPGAASSLPEVVDEWTAKAAQVLEATETADGYVLALGVGTGRLVEQIVRQSRCNVIAVDPDAEKVAKLRTQFQQAGLYGTRISIHVGDPMSYPLPPYLASLIVSEDPGVLQRASGPAFVNRLFRCLRPYGGTACLTIPAAQRNVFSEEVAACNLAGATVRPIGDLVLLTRCGALPEMADWSHRGANAANTGASQDRFLKPPLGRLWFDGSLRWFRTPGSTTVRVAGGRVLVKSGKLHAIDVYTGRHLWETALPAAHNSGEMVATEDAVYLTAGKSCVVLDPATGQASGEISFPADIDGQWTNVRVAGDYLVAGNGKTLVCMNRRNGEMLWKLERKRNIASIALGGGKVFCADLINKQQAEAAKRRGEGEGAPLDVVTEAFDLSTGETLWQIPGASRVRYSEPLDLLVASSGVYRAKDGTRIWNAGGAWPITDDTLLSGNSELFATHDLLTGAKSDKQWTWNRRGCTSLRASSIMLTTRFQGNAAYVDLATGQITSIWNVRAACSNNLFPANGVLNIPNLSGGCTCNYMPVSQAFVPMSVIE